MRALAAEDAHPRRVDAVLRGFDLTVASVTLAASSPLLAALAGLVRVVDGAPVLYRGQRVGRAGRPFTMLKLRTLRVGAEQRLAGLAGAELDAAAQAEITRLGRGLRAVHLDELPQLWCVVRGDMALVGPRPIRPAFFAALGEEIPQYWQRLVVRPGLTGLAQVRITRSTGWDEKLAHDLEWAADRSLALELRVLWATGVRLLRRARGLPDRPPEGV